MGRVETELEISNFNDILNEAREVRTLRENGLVDTGAALLALHRAHIEKLGLAFVRKVKMKTANGSPERNMYGVARVRIGDREGEFNVVEIPDDVPILIGYIVLEQLDFSVDPAKQKLIPNTDSGGHYALDAY